jgi:hypothetical protein
MSNPINQSLGRITLPPINTTLLKNPTFVSPTTITGTASIFPAISKSPITTLSEPLIVSRNVPSLKLDADKWTVYIFNIIIHFAVLLTFLFMFFAFVGAKEMTDSYNNQFNDLIKDNLDDALQKNKNQTNPDPRVNLLLNGLPLGKMIDNYSEPSPDIASTNSNIFQKTGIAIGFLWILVFAFYGTIRHYSNFKIPLKTLLIENCIGFAVVGAIEAMFFCLIVMKYVPTMPSFVVNTFYTAVKSNM